VIGKGPSARSIRLKLPHFTIACNYPPGFGHCAASGALLAPSIASIIMIWEAMQAVVTRASRLLGVQVDKGGVEEIGRRAVAPPLVALRLLRRVRDFAQVRADGRVTQEVAREALDLHR